MTQRQRTVSGSDAVAPQYLTGVLNHPHSGGVGSDVQRVEDVDHELPHGLKLVWPDAARAVNQENQIHRARLTLLVATLETESEWSH